jgi:hypothetical protein
MTVSSAEMARVSGTSFPNHSIGLAVPPWVSPKQERGKTEVEKTDPKQ